MQIKDIQSISWQRIVGFAAHQSFIFSVFYMGTNKAITWGQVSFERAELAFMLVFMLLALAVIGKFPQKAKEFLTAPSTLLGMALVLVGGSFAEWLQDSMQFAAYLAEGLFIGFPAGCMLVAWGSLFGKATPRNASIEIFASFALAGVFCFALSFAPDAFVSAVAKCLPLVSAFLMVSLVGDAPSSSAAASGAAASGAAAANCEKSSADANNLTSKILAGALLYGIAAGFMEAYRSDPGSLTTPTFSATLLILALFSLAVVQSLCSKNNKESLGSMYRIVILVTMAGFLFQPVLSKSGIPGEAIVLAGLLGVVASFICLFLAMAAVSHMDATQAFCKGFVAVYAGELLGIMGANVFDASVLLDETPYIIVAFAGLACLYAYLFLFTEKDFRALSACVDQPDQILAAAQHISQSFKLSERESEVLVLALRGRTNERIAQELVIAKSTADTHLRRIYAKTGTHNRQQLIDKAYAYVNESSQ